MGIEDLAGRPNPRRSKARRVAEKLAHIDQARAHGWRWSEIREALGEMGLEWETDAAFRDTLRRARQLVERGKVSPETPVEGSDPPDESASPPSQPAGPAGEGRPGAKGPQRLETPSEKKQRKEKAEQDKRFGAPPLGKWSAPPPRKNDEEEDEQ